MPSLWVTIRNAPGKSCRLSIKASMDSMSRWLLGSSSKATDELESWPRACDSSRRRRPPSLSEAPIAAEHHRAANVAHLRARRADSICDFLFDGQLGIEPLYVGLSKEAGFQIGVRFDFACQWCEPAGQDI